MLLAKSNIVVVVVVKVVVVVVVENVVVENVVVITNVDVQKVHDLLQFLNSMLHQVHRIKTILLGCRHVDLLGMIPQLWDWEGVILRCVNYFQMCHTNGWKAS